MNGFFHGGWDLPTYLQMEEAVVYRLRDRDGAVLYVGLTRGLKGRLSSHKSKPWFGAVASVDFDQVGAQLGSWLERCEIRRHRPPHNILWHPERDPHHGTQNINRVAA